ncbi:hypothetical protein B0H13DRAFT_2062096 [Mycena leptocephala]|nr:hypothetical protein B0H13DRAFT_2062096 [Mycena leptocephala]
MIEDRSLAFKFQQPVSGFFFLSSTLSTMSARRGKQASVAESSGDQNLEEQDEYRDIPSDDEDRQEDAESDGYSGTDAPAAKRRKTAKGKERLSAKGRSAVKSAKGKKMKTMAAKGKGRSGRQGRLAGLLEIPMDVFYLILCHLVPEYLVNLARMNRQFRSALMSPQSRFVWKAARQNVAGTPAPDPPSDMTEPAWANLLFTPEKACFECGKTGTNHIDFAFRRRLCLACRKTHLLRMKRNYKSSFEAELFDLVPYTLSGGYFGGCSGSPMSYWIPQLEAMQSKVAQLKNNIKAGNPDAHKEYDDFRKARSLQVKNVLETVEDLESWAHTKEAEQFHMDSDRRDQRYNAIVDRLVAAGYNREEVPSRYTLGSYKELQVNSVRALTDAAWAKIAPKLMERLDTSRVEKARNQRQSKIANAYNAFLDSLVPSQKFFLPPSLFPPRQYLPFRRSVAPKLPCIQQVIDDPGTDDLSQAEFEARITTAFFADTSAWALERMKAIAQAASLTISFPPSVAWVTFDIPFRDRRLGELGKIFDLATAVFVVDTWKSGSSIYYQFDYNWTNHWPSRGPAPTLGDDVVFIGRDAMHMAKPNDVMAFSARGADAVRAVLTLEHLDAATTTTELDARTSLFKCTHCAEDEFMFTWRGCVEHVLVKKDHPEPSWSLVSGAEASSLRPNGHHNWLCNHCVASFDTYADVLGHVSQLHAVVSPQEDIDLVYLPNPEECVPRVLSMSCAA